MLQNYSICRVKQLRHFHPASCQSLIIDRELLSGVVDSLVLLCCRIGEGRMLSVDCEKSPGHREADPGSWKVFATY